MSRLLVTGADGFVGRWLVRSARAAGRAVIAVIPPGAPAPAEWNNAASAVAIEVLVADLADPAAAARIAGSRPTAVVHLAAIASSVAARHDPAAAMVVNCDATVRLARALAGAGSPCFLFASTAEVYGPGHADAIAESAPVKPVSPYAESKARAEKALADVANETGLPVIVARSFPHTGPGQTTTYVLPALVARLLAARKAGAATVRVGNLSAVRDFLDVRDVVRAYLMLLAHGRPGAVYNVASGVGRRLSECFDLLARLVGVTVTVEPDAALLRPSDIPVLIGDASRLRAATGWSPEIPFERTLQDLVNAQAD
ncbi:MAG: NAD-dependent epimerase/dehydratase family protein [Gemmatimonadales bacterium]